MPVSFHNPHEVIAGGNLHHVDRHGSLPPAEGEDSTHAGPYQTPTASHDAIRPLSVLGQHSRGLVPGTDCHQASACGWLGVHACEPLIAMEAYQDVVRAAFAACCVANRLQTREA